jgi:hypothetical protein
MRNNSLRKRILNYPPKGNPPQLDSQSLERSQIAQTGILGGGPNLCNNLIILLFILLILSAFIITVNGITIPSDRNKPTIPKEIQQFVTDEVQVPPIPAFPKSIEHEEIEREHPAEVVIPLASDPVQIRKFLFPLNTNYYAGDAIGVFVEIKCKIKQLNQLKVKEFVSEDLNIINCSKYCYRLVTQEEMRDYISRSNEEYFKDFYLDSKINNDKVHWNDRYYIDVKSGRRVLTWNNSLDYNIDNDLKAYLRNIINIPWSENARYSYLSQSRENRSICIYNDTNKSECLHLIMDKSGRNAILQYNKLSYIFKADSESLYGLNNQFDILIGEPRANERYVYWYFIKPNKPGYYDSITTIMSSGNSVRDYLDMDFDLPINISYPKPDVEIGLRKLKLLRNEELDLQYEIKYDRDQNNSNKKIEFYKRLQFYDLILKNTNYSYGNKYIFNRRLINKSNLIDIKIKYPNEGIYNLPSITIDGEEYPFQAYTVIVDTRFERYGALIGFILASITFLLGFYSKSNKSIRSGSRLYRSNMITTSFSRNANSPLYRRVWKYITNNKILVVALFLLIIIILIFIYWFIEDQPLYVPFSSLRLLP